MSDFALTGKLTARDVMLQILLVANGDVPYPGQEDDHDGYWAMQHIAKLAKHGMSLLPPSD